MHLSLSNEMTPACNPAGAISYVETDGSSDLSLPLRLPGDSSSPVTYCREIFTRITAAGTVADSHRLPDGHLRALHLVRFTKLLFILSPSILLTNFKTSYPNDILDLKDFIALKVLTSSSLSLTYINKVHPRYLINNTYLCT